MNDRAFSAGGKMSDIVDQLLDSAERARRSQCLIQAKRDSDAAAEISALRVAIAALRAENERLRAALKPFADYAPDQSKLTALPATVVITNGSPVAKRQLTIGDCYNARRALEGK